MKARINGYRTVQERDILYDVALKTTSEVHEDKDGLYIFDPDGERYYLEHDLDENGILVSWELLAIVLPRSIF